MKRIYLTEKKHTDAWKKSMQTPESAEARKAAADALAELGLEKDGACEVVLTRSQASAPIGHRLKTVDAAMVFLKDASQEVKDAARDDLGNMERIALPVIISDDSEDRDRDVVVPGGGDLSPYKTNPVMLFGHNHSIPAIGNGFGTHPMDNTVRSIATFNPSDVDAFGFMIGRMFEERIMRAISIGFIPKEWTFEQERGPLAMRYLSWELIEFSAVNVPSNRNALVQARGFGIDVAPAITLLSKSLDEGGGAPAEEAWRLLAPRKSFSHGALKDALEKLTTAPADPKAARAAARSVPKTQVVMERQVEDSTEWRGVAVMLGQEVGADAFLRAVRANTYGATDEEQAERKKDAAESQASAEALVSAASDDGCEAHDDEAGVEVEPILEPTLDNETPTGDDAPHQEATAPPLVDLGKILALAERRLA